MPARINGGLALAALGALVLLVSLFLTWYEPSRDAWTVFELNDLILAALGVLVLVISGLDLIGPLRLREKPDWGLISAGVGALIIVVATLIQPPPSAPHGTPQLGAWLAFGGAVAITLGGLLFWARVSVVITPRSRERDRAEEEYAEEQPTETAPLPEEERG